MHASKRPMAILTLLSALYLALVWPGRDSPPFLEDDESAIELATAMETLGIGPIESIRHLDSIGFYRPIKNVTFRVVAEMAGGDDHDAMRSAMATMRTIGFAYPILAAFGLFALAHRSIRHPAAGWLALGTAGTWLLSASLTSTAVWLSAQNIAVAVAFSTLALMGAGRFIGGTNRVRDLVALTGGSIAFAAALLCYDSAVAVPGFFALIQAPNWFLDPPARRRIAGRLALTLGIWTLITAGWLYLRHAMGAVTDGGRISLLFHNTDRLDLMAASAWIYWRHFLMWLWPFGTLEIGGDYINGLSAGRLAILGAWGFLAAYFITSAMLIRAALRRNALFAGIAGIGMLIGFCGAFPAGNFIPLYSGPLADYYTVFPALGWSLALAAGCGWLITRLTAPGRLAAAVALAAVVLTRIAGVAYIPTVAGNFAQPLDALMATATARPNMITPQITLGGFLMSQGETERGLAIIKDAYDKAPDFRGIAYATALAKARRWDESVAIFEHASIDPEEMRKHRGAEIDLAEGLYHTGRFDEAVAQLDRGIPNTNSHQRFLFAHHLKAVALRKLGRNAEALETIRTIIPRTEYKNHEAIVALGIIAAKDAGDDETTARWISKAREQYPDSAAIKAAIDEISR